MSQDRVAPSLELEQDPSAWRREWRFERFGWVMLALIVVAALAGVFGDGPAARRDHRSAVGSLRVEYDRVVRYGAATVIVVTIGAREPADSVAVFRLGRPFLDGFDVEVISPEPVETRATAGFVEYHLRRAAPGTATRIDLNATPRRRWRQSARLGTDAGTLDLPLFVLP